MSPFAVSPTRNLPSMDHATPTTTTTLSVPVDLDLATELVEVGRAASPALAVICATIGQRIMWAHERTHDAALRTG